MVNKKAIYNVYFISFQNLDKTIDNKALYETFSVFGNILSCKVATNPSGQSKGYGFVQFDNEESATTAINKLNGMLINDKPVFVGPFVRKQDRDNSSMQTKFNNVFVKNLDESTTKDELLRFSATQLSDPPGDLAFRSKGIARYPLGEKKALGGATQAFSVYEGDQILYLDVELEKGAKPGILTLPLSLRLQACNDQVCLSPATIPVTVKVEVGDLKSPVAPFHPEMFQGTLASQSAPDASENIIAK